MPKRKLEHFRLSGDTSSGRGFKLRKCDQQDVTITSAAVRLPVFRPRDAELKTTESRVATQSRASPLKDIDRLAIRLIWLSLESLRERPRFEILKPMFPKSSLLPTEIRMKIWKLARPDPRVIKLFQSTKNGIANTNSRGQLIHFARLRCPTDHLVSKIPVPNLLHICSESRAVALEWYRLRFQPTCGRGGTYFDTKRDYIYYGPEERKLLISPDSRVPGYGWIKDTNRWAKDRHSIPNMVIYHDFRNSFTPVFRRFMELSVWCNQYADKILWVYENELGRGALVLDLKPQLEFRTICSNYMSVEDTEDTRLLFRHWLFLMQIVSPWWKCFNPTSVEVIEQSATANQMQKCGFKKGLFSDKKVDFLFPPTSG